MVTGAERWPWSSYRQTADLEVSATWFDNHWLLSTFAKRRSLAVRRYMEFVANGVQQASPWEMLKQQVFLGSDAFVKKLHKKVVRQNLSEVPKIQRRGKPKCLRRIVERRPVTGQCF